MKRAVLKRLIAAVAISTFTVPVACAQETRAEQRQENRETRQAARQEIRQDTQQNRAQTPAQNQTQPQAQVQAQTQNQNQNPRQEARQDRREARQQRSQQRLDNRSQYYTNDTWSQLDPWLTRNNVTPMQRVTQAAGAAVGATEKVLNTASDVAARANNNATATYGYTNPNGAGQNGWFYDYYAYSPTYYSAPASGSNVYGSATRYYDLDNDGVYENLNVFRDTDNNASYDVYDRYDFGDIDKTDTTTGQRVEDLADAPEDASRHTVTGKVYASKTAKVGGTQHLIVRLSEAEAQGDSKEANIVDIGPASLWNAKPLQANTAITATGPVERIGDKLILVADTVKLGDAKAINISRGAPQIEGQVVDVTDTEIKGKSHTLAVIESDSKRQLVDLGPKDNLKVKVQPQTKIVVQGVPVRVRNHSIVQAEQVTIDGQNLTIRRW